MKVRHLFSLLFFLLLFSLFSCKKDSGADVTFPHTLYPTQIAQKGEIKVYTANGEMTDASQKEKFLGKDKQFFNLTFDPDVTTSQILNRSITFVSRDTIMSSLSTEKFVADNNNGQFIFTDTKYRVPVDTASIFYEFLKYRYLIINAPYFPGAGQPYSDVGYYVSNNLNYTSSAPFLGKSVFVGYGNYNTLKVSVFSSKFSRKIITGSSYSYYAESGFSYNEFNSAVIKQLKANDTLAVQEFYLTIKSK